MRRRRPGTAYALRVRVLSIDGGGIRGLIPAMVLAEVERRTGRRIHELFDLIAGTSTGGILACALTKPQPQTAEELVGLYVDEGPRIFHRDLLKRVRSVEGFLDERYDDDGLNGALREHLGDARLQQALTPMVVTAYADVAPAGPIELIASLGTGSKTEDHPIRGAEGWGQLEWARPIIDAVFDGVADTVDYQVSTLLPAGAYVRLQTRLRDASGALDDASPANLRALQGE